MSVNRRDFLSQFVPGMAAIAFCDMAQGKRHFNGRANRVLQIFCPGGVSHLDTFDYKPALEKFHGQPMPGGAKEVTFQGVNGNLMKSPWKFIPHGQSGKMVAETLPELGALVDDMAFVHSMTARSNTHGPACVQMNSGFIFDGFPSAGAWVSYALGRENDNLPSYVAIPDIRGIPPSGPSNWSNGFLPGEHQAVVFNAADPIRNLSRPGSLTQQQDLAARAHLRRMNEAFLRDNPGNPDLEARIAAYELAARMQLAAPEASDISKETEATLELYGANSSNPLISAYAKNCLLARRLLERGVRYVQLFCASRASGVDGLLNWDAHKTLKTDYERHCPVLDKPTAGLIRDMKSRGLLKDTLILWTTEFGRMPTHQAGTLGRDHNPEAFTVWMMGAGVKGGTTHGATDDFGRRSVQDVSNVHDIHATMLHLLGMDHEKLTYYNNGINRRLTDVHGHVLRGLLA